MFNVYEVFKTDRFHVTINNDVNVMIVCRHIQIIESDSKKKLAFRDQFENIICLIDLSDVTDIQYADFTKKGLDIYQSILSLIINQERVWTKNETR